MHAIPLAGGGAMPAIGLGTWPLKGRQCEATVRLALDLGYRHIDTAEMYGNEAEVGVALAASGVAREAVFLTTKIWTDHLRAADLRRAAEASLRRLGTDHVDLLLIHWPNPAVPLAETLGAMAALAGEGKTRAIGVSNFPPDLLARAIAASPLPLAADQVEFHVRRPQAALCRAARAAGIAVTAYSPLAKGRLAGDPAVREIAAKHGRTPGQVALRWLIEQDGVAAIPKATGGANLRANLDVFDFALDDWDRQVLAAT